MATLDDGETISLDVPFTTDGQWCCCGSCTSIKVPTFSVMTISAPPGYSPRIDAGIDAGAASDVVTDAPSD